MRSCRKLFAVVALVAAASAPALANIAPAQSGTSGQSKPSKSIAARMQLRPDAKAKEAKLLIPRAVFEQMRAEIEGRGDSQAAGVATANRFDLTGTQTAFAGLCLSLSLVFGGMWFVNSRAAGRKTARAAAALAVVAFVGAAAGAVAYANAGPPAFARSLNSKILVPEAASYGGPYGEVKVEIVDGDANDYIELRLPKWKGDKEGE
ncbi:MAG TPA: hypothetical protein VF064_12680 [Pyrinomonadaceae bacterium]